MKFVHCADLHLDTAFSGLGDGKSAAVRQAELRRTFLSIIELAKTADALLIAGDLFDQDSVEAETIATLCSGFASLGDIPVFIAAGNHDPLSEQSYYKLMSLSPNVHVFGTDLACFSVADCDICGISFSGAVQQESLLPEFRCSPDRPTLLLMHGDLGGNDYNPVDRAMVAASGLSYLALGHIHSYIETKIGNTLCVYPGCPEGRGFDELDDKGVVCAEVTKDSVTTQFVPLCRRRHREISVNISGLVTHDEIIRRVRQEILTPEDLYKIVLVGETELVPDETVVAEAFSDCFFLKVCDKTKRPLRLEELAKEAGVRGQFVQKILARQEEGKEALCRRALEYGLSALAGEKVKSR
ncbi:MAG: DNA repair exonuclease [Clostridia bacterium]|nr:DNA repair exonuclease [Clostridia bacterium]